MFCMNCGKQIPDGAKFCPGCGANQQPDTATAPVKGPEATPVKEPQASPTPQVDLGKLFSDNYGSAQEKPKPKPKKKKLSGKIKGFLIALLVFVVTACGRGILRGGLELGLERLFGLVGDSIKASQAKTYEELDALMSELDVVVTGYNRSNWAEEDQSGPLLQVYMKNDSGKNITSVEVAIATWDEYGNPVKLTTDDGEYNLSSNVTYLKLNFLIWLDGTLYTDKGLGLSSNSVIPQRIQAIPTSWTYSDGEKVSNPYAEDWLYRYENKENTRSDLSEIQFPQDQVMSETDLLAALLTQPLVTTNYEIAQWEEGDLLCATITNNSDVTIKNIYIAYATWDADNNPVCITNWNGDLRTSNITRVQMSDLSLEPGQSYGADNGAALHQDSAKVAKFSAIAYRYEDAEGNVWENPCYYAWLNLYEGA